MICIRTNTQNQLENDNHLYPFFNFHQNENGKIECTYHVQFISTPKATLSLNFDFYILLILQSLDSFDLFNTKKRKIWLKKLLLFLQFPLRLNSAGNHWTDISTFILYITWMYERRYRKGFPATEISWRFSYHMLKQTKNSIQMCEKYFEKL